MQCTVDSNPQTIAIWNKDSGLPATATVNNGRLHIASTSREHAGYYTCSAANVVESHQEQRTVNILCKCIHSLNITIALKHPYIFSLS